MRSFQAAGIERCTLGCMAMRANVAPASLLSSSNPAANGAGSCKVGVTASGERRTVDSSVSDHSAARHKGRQRVFRTVPAAPPAVITRFQAQHETC